MDLKRMSKKTDGERGRELQEGLLMRLSNISCSFPRWDLVGKESPNRERRAGLSIIELKIWRKPSPATASFVDFNLIFWSHIWKEIN
mmetsp:Transcript_52316/g.59790  ORF Transcript_52316/g.59790 Transcript_52316/m.59790 type:complete len:87 (+) Transcript_52316:164-424(+)